MPPERPTVLMPPQQGGQVPGGVPQGAAPQGGMPQGQPGMGGEESPEALKNAIVQQLQQLPPEQLVKMAQNPDQFMRQMADALIQEIGNPELAMQLVEQIFNEIFTMAQAQSNQVISDINPELAEAPPGAEAAPQGGTPQQVPPGGRPTVLGGFNG